MRKINFILCTLVLLACVSCSSDSEEVILEDSIVGSWVSYEMKSVNIDTGEDHGVVDWKTFEVRFFNDGTCVYNGKQATYKLMGENLDIFTEAHSFNYIIEERSKDKMTLSIKMYNNREYVTMYYYLQRKK